MLVSQAVRETRRHLGGDPAHRNVLNGEALAADTTLVLTYAANLALGSIIESPAGELCYVWSYDSATKTATVERGYDGTTAATIANGAILRINPRFPERDILAAIQYEIRSLSSEGLFQRKSTSVTWDSGEEAYDVSAVTDLLSPYALVYDISGRSHWDYQWTRQGDFLRPYEDAGETTATLHYRAPFVDYADTSSDLATFCKLPDTAQDIVPLGAAARLILNKEGLRTDVLSQQLGRKAEDVPVSSNARLGQFLRLERERRLSREVRRLREVWPARIG